MPYGVYLSASGAHAQSHRMQLISHNLANSDTPGYKPQETTLRARFAEMIEEGEVSPGGGGADDIGGGVTIAKAATNFATGPMKQTGKRTDFAINDPESFFVVQDADEQKLLTRAGNFQFDSLGRLAGENGQRVLASDGQPIQIDPSLPFDVASQGVIRQGDEAWELMVARPKNLGDVSRVGQNHFKTLAPYDQVPTEDRKVVAGTLEQSAVSPTTTMMELIETSRVYEANVRMIQNQDSVMGTLISRVLGS